MIHVSLSEYRAGISKVALGVMFWNTERFHCWLTVGVHLQSNDVVVTLAQQPRTRVCSGGQPEIRVIFFNLAFHIVTKQCKCQWTTWLMDGAPKCDSLVLDLDFLTCHVPNADPKWIKLMIIFTLCIPSFLPLFLLLLSLQVYYQSWYQWFRPYRSSSIACCSYSP